MAIECEGCGSYVNRVLEALHKGKTPETMTEVPRSFPTAPDALPSECLDSRTGQRKVNCKAPDITARRRGF